MTYGCFKHTFFTQDHVFKGMSHVFDFIYYLSRLYLQKSSFAVTTATNESVTTVLHVI